MEFLKWTEDAHKNALTGVISECTGQKDLPSKYKLVIAQMLLQKKTVDCETVADEVERSGLGYDENIFYHAWRSVAQVLI